MTAISGIMLTLDEAKFVQSMCEDRFDECPEDDKVLAGKLARLLVQLSGFTGVPLEERVGS